MPRSSIVGNRLCYYVVKDASPLPADTIEPGFVGAISYDDQVQSLLSRQKSSRTTPAEAQSHTVIPEHSCETFELHADIHGESREAGSRMMTVEPMDANS